MDSKQQRLTFAQILTGIGLDAITVVAIPFHDTVEDTSFTHRDLDEEFGPEVTKLTDDVTKLKQGSPDMNGLYGRPGDDAMKYRRKMLCELEDNIFRYLEPEKYHEIAAQLDECWADRENYIAFIKTSIQEEFVREGLQASITGRPKHIYSIYCKMKRKDLPFSQIYDIRAICIVVDTTLQCYRVLNIIHTIFRAIPGEFDDYIVSPKSNLYRSLHTAVVDNEGKTLEVQIRTRDMHEESEYGIAAHWRYKEEQHSVPSLTHDPETSVTDNDLIRTAKITWTHLKDIRDYYTQLDRLEAEAKT